MGQDGRVWDADTGQTSPPSGGTPTPQWSPPPRSAPTASGSSPPHSITRRGSGRRLRPDHRHPPGAHRRGQSAAFSPDGKRVVTASKDNTARSGTPTPPRLSPPSRGTPHQVYSAAFSPTASGSSPPHTTRRRGLGRRLRQDPRHPPGAHRSGPLRRVQLRRQAGRHHLMGQDGAVAAAADSRASRNLAARVGGYTGTKFQPRCAHCLRADDSENTTPAGQDADRQGATAPPLRAQPLGRTPPRSAPRQGVATAQLTNTALVWTTTPAAPLPPPRATAAGNSAAYTPREAGLPASVLNIPRRVWDADSGMTLAILRGNRNQARKSLAFSPGVMRRRHASGTRPPGLSRHRQVPRLPPGAPERSARRDQPDGKGSHRLIDKRGRWPLIRSRAIAEQPRALGSRPAPEPMTPGP